MVANIFEAIGEAITGFITALTSGVNGVVSLFYNATSGELTFVGVLMLIATGIGVVIWAFNLIRGLIQRRAV